MTFTRAEIETTKALERPTVRCQIDCDYIDEDGRKTTGVRNANGQIALDGNNPWLVIHAAGKQLAFRVSWCLLLEVLNDRFARPVNFQGQRVEYEV